MNFDEVGQRNMRSITEFELFWLSKYLVGTWLVDLDIHKLIKSAISVRRSQWIEWWGKEESQLLPLILKSSAITKTLLIFASVSLRYFKAVCKKSK